MQPFLSIVISAFPVIGALLPVYDVGCIFDGFTSGFLFIFCNIISVKCLRHYPCHISMGHLYLVGSGSLSTVCQ